LFVERQLFWLELELAEEVLLFVQVLAIVIAKLMVVVLVAYW
jgi:hypothetical protein